MELRQLRCFVAAADELHFGQAARRLGVLPAVLGREVQKLEAELRVRLFLRSTRQVSLTPAGQTLLPRARRLLKDAAAIATAVRADAGERGEIIRVGAIDSAATGLIPDLIADIHAAHPTLKVALTEDRTVRLLPRLLAGSLDLVLGRPPESMDPRLVTRFLLDEQPLVALPMGHPLAVRDAIAIGDLLDVPMILPSRRARPHSHDLTVRLFEAAGIPLLLEQTAEEKHTILGLVAAGIGAAVVPRWNALAGARGVSFLAVKGAATLTLPLAAIWHGGLLDRARDQVLAVLDANLPRYASTA